MNLGFKINAAIRSLHYWASVPAVNNHTLMPMTAFHAMCDSNQYEASRTAFMNNAVDPKCVRKLAVDVITLWSAPFTHVNIHALYWAMSSFNNIEQAQIAVYFNHTHPQIMKTDDLQKIPADIMMRLCQNLDSLEASLLAQDPMMPTHLRNTHQLLISYPESVHLLADSEIATLITAAQKHTAIVITAAAAKSPAGRKKISADDL